MLKLFWVLAAVFLAASSATAAPPSPLQIAGALSDPARPAPDLARDGARKPAEVLAFMGVGPGDRVADFMAGGGYFTRLFARIVGPSGHVYVFLPDEQLKNCVPGEVAGAKAVGRDPAYHNVTVETGPANGFKTSETLDAVFTAQNYHDLHDGFMRPATAQAFDKAVFNALRPGGVFIVIDHVAEAGSKLRDTDTLHRIDPAVIVQEVLAAGFTLTATSDLLRSPGDGHTLLVFNPKVRGHTDQVLLKFTKPL